MESRGRSPKPCSFHEDINELFLLLLLLLLSLKLMSLLSLSLLLLLSSKSLQLLCNYLVFFCFSGSSNLSSRSSGSLGPQHLRNSRGVLRIADDCAPPIKLTVYLASNTRSLFEIVQSARWLPLSLLMLGEFFDFELYFFTFSFSALMIF